NKPAVASSIFLSNNGEGETFAAQTEPESEAMVADVDDDNDCMGVPELYKHDNHALLSSYNQAFAQEQFLTYEDITTGISIQFPSDWEKSVNLDKFVTFRAQPETDTRVYPAALGLKIQDLASQNVSLQEVTKVQISELKATNPNLKLLESTSTTLAGKPAHKVVFSATDNNQVERKAMQLWTVIDDKAILITYKAQPDKYSSYLPTIEKMINSLQVKS
ncbi:MAG: PsbP-related protein, partial [Nitrososphaeraceae archaeon]